MSAEENATVVKRSLEAFNARDFRSLQAIPVADDVEIHDVPRGVVAHGPKGFDQFHQDLHTAFPDSRMVVTNVQATENQVFIEFNCPDAKQTGRLGLIPATDRTVRMHFTGVYEIENGKITKIRYYYDGASLMHQLGFRIT